MQNFDFHNPTRLILGRDTIPELGKYIAEYGNKKVLLLYGKGSIMKNGVYDQVVKSLKDHGIEYVEMSGVRPNPVLSKVVETVALMKKEKVDAIVAVGGGSVLDTSKISAASYYYEGNPWDFYERKVMPEKALPIYGVLTISATGSEMNSGAVITNMDTNEKLGTGNPSMAPKFSILDPTYTYTLPANQTAAGTADIISHIFEVYFSSTKEAYLQNRMAEAMLKTCIKYGEIAIKQPENYEARANLMWTSSLAINGLLSYGKVTEWSTHGMEHELSAYYDITHGVGLAILTPHWMKYILNEETLEKFVEYGVNVWGIDAKADKYEIANEAIDKTREYFISLGIPSSLREVGINEEKLEEMAKQATRRGKLGNFRALDAEDVLSIFKASL